MLSCQLCCCCTQSPPTTPSAVSNHPQFFESINPLDGFEDNNALEEYLYNQSKKIEPGKDDSKWELHNQKSKRSQNTLKSPGVKVPKWQQASSTLANGSPASPNVYHPSNPGNLTLTKPLAFEDRTRSTTTVNSPVEDCPFAIVDIHPGQQPKYIRDAPGTIIGGSQRSSLPPRRNIPPPSPSAKSEVPQEMAPPPLYPRRISPARTEDSPPLSAASDHSFFPIPSSPTDSAWASSSESGTSPPMVVPPVPPRRAANRGTHPSAGLPTPLPVDSVSKHFWRGEPSPTSPTVSLSVPLPTETTNSSPPALPPRQRVTEEESFPPPRPPKKNPRKPLCPSEPDGPTPPPLPPKTYKNRLHY